MNNTVKNILSVSQAIKSFDRPSVVEPFKVQKINEYNGFRIEIANTVSKLLDASHLAYSCYLKKGFVLRSHFPFILNEWDISGDSVCLVAYDDDNICVGTMTLVPDDNQLPVDITFNSELNLLREKGHHLCEFTRFVIDKEFRNQSEILVALMDWAPLVAEFHFSSSDIIIEVNPRHQTFYSKKLLFEIETGVKNCSLVNNAPAVLLRLPIKTFHRFRGEYDSDSSSKRLLFHRYRSRDLNELRKMKRYLFKESRKIQPLPELRNKMKAFA
ncbi:MAG: hypothetical protein COA79_08590 [Planctomycetota bacterium]|nr:MAG: hypothetical protein COA79_08590 [Planctomycetota bacterium]